jgi:iron only hydrogenase large subunit-like protein
LEREAKTLFIGPCLAKKAEAKEKDIAGAVDFVFDLRGGEDDFRRLRIDPAKEEEDVREHSSRRGASMP